MILHFYKQLEDAEAAGSGNQALNSKMLETALCPSSSS